MDKKILVWGTFISLVVLVTSGILAGTNGLAIGAIIDTAAAIIASVMIASGHFRYPGAKPR